MNADKAYLISFSKDDRASNYVKQIENELRTRYSHISLEKKFVDIWDLYECIEEFRSILDAEIGNHVYVNVSTGTKITAIAGMLSCMIWHAQPYYARVSYANSRPTVEETTEFVEEPDLLPTYDIYKPKSEFLMVLDMLSKSRGSMRKATIIKQLEELGLIALRDRTGGRIELSQAAKHSQLRAILQPMEKDWSYITIKSNGRRSEVSLTEQGRSALRIFGSLKDREDA